MESSEPHTLTSGYRWVILTLCWAAFTMTSVDRATWGPAADSVGKDLGVAVAGLGLFATTYYIGYVISNLIGGYFADWVGSRVTVGASILLSGLLMFGFGEADTYATGIAFQGLIGLCAGAELGAGVKLITTWFLPEKRGFAMGIFMTATSLGLVIANAIVPSLIQTYTWRASYHVFGSFSVVIGIICLFLLRPGRVIEPGQRAGRPDLRPLVRNRSLLLIGLAGFSALFGTYGFVTWSNLLMTRSANIDPVDAGSVVVLFGLVAVFSKPVVGFFGDVIGISRRNLSIGILFTFASCLVAFSFATSLTQFLIVAPFLGVAAYVYSPVMLAMIPSLSGGHLAGSAAGGVNAVWQLGSTLAPALIGVVYNATDSFQVVFLVLAAGPLIGIVPLLGLRDRDITERIAPSDTNPVANVNPTSTAK